MPLTFLSTIYRNFLHFLRMSLKKIHWCEVPLDPILIQTYCDLLQVQYELEGCAHMTHFYVEAIKLFKTVDVFQHEYLAAKVKALDGATFYLSFERGHGEVVDIQSQVPSSPSAPAQGPYAKISSFDSLFHKRRADDKVTPIGTSGKHNSSDRVLCTLSFDPPLHPCLYRNSHFHPLPLLDPQIPCVVISLCSLSPSLRACYTCQHPPQREK